MIREDGVRHLGVEKQRFLVNNEKLRRPREIHNRLLRDSDSGLPTFRTARQHVPITVSHPAYDILFSSLRTLMRTVESSFLCVIASLTLQTGSASMTSANKNAWRLHLIRNL